ncbi:MAG: nucleoside 2-deoxyribosyltransferase [Acetobacteraceae bacterium]|nr:nucleoside 2-deoxyribosyltransferase [Acetobacteraceae bacterium]
MSAASSRVYLAGPDVFLPAPQDWAARRQAVCARFGLAGVTPLDALAGEPAGWAALPEWRRIALRNEAHIRSCTAVIANLTPFRGPSADVGTVYEVGFARALGMPVFGYATVAAPFLARTLAALGEGARVDADGGWWDLDGLLVEQFGLFDNLMIEGGILASGGALVVDDAADRWQDLAVFERCVAAVAERLAG